MKRTFLISLTLILLLALSTAAQQRQLIVEDAHSERRVALVIGNSSYEISPLKNPVNDARDMAQALRELGFEVIYRENLNQNDMKRAIRTFGEKLRGGGTGLFYYAGHGVQVKGINYLVPVGVRIESEEEIEYECVDAGFVLAQMESANNSMNIVILDACRNNPFVRSFRSASRGLAQMDAPGGTLIAYSTAPGSVARDGAARNGLYTQELLKFMRTPNLGIEEMFKRVRIAVRTVTQGKQIPWESSSLIGDFYFAQTPSAADAPNSQKVVSSVNPAAIEIVYWESIKNSTNPEDFKAYLERYPGGQFAELARIRLGTVLGAMSTADGHQVGGKLVIPSNEKIRVELLYTLSTDESRLGDRFEARVIEPQKYAGATVDGSVTRVRRASWRGRAEIQLSFDRIQFSDGRRGNFQALVTEVIGSTEPKSTTESKNVHLNRGQQLVIRTTSDAVIQ
ncbi:MAG TPA: caspase domain-containing protein [Pyrinomonadaceae bacterium]|jgi:hypothetical protein|nr:caspase domain-containing protein [Pyrinomonadaceae bacterium]